MRLYNDDIVFTIHEIHSALGMTGTWGAIEARGLSGGEVTVSPSTDKFHEQMIKRLNGETVERARRCLGIWRRLSETVRADLWAYYSLQPGSAGTQPSQQPGVSKERKALLERSEQEAESSENRRRQNYDTRADLDPKLDDDRFNRLATLTSVFGTMTGLALRIAKERGKERELETAVCVGRKRDESAIVRDYSRRARERALKAHRAWDDLDKGSPRAKRRQPDKLDSLTAHLRRKLEAG